MHINADFSKIATVIPREDDWVCSPESGVDRLMLDRIGAEVARATSIVRYAPGSSFSRHEHAKGEEFLVLDGIFSDEHADYETGTYVRNPPGSGHSPHSKDGCRILVKLRQFDPDDLKRVVIDTSDNDLWQQTEDGKAELLPLHQYGSEKVQMQRVPAGGTYTSPTDGTEIFVISGSITLGDDELPAESWLRFPVGHEAVVNALENTVLWVKVGHLPGG